MNDVHREVWQSRIQFGCEGDFSENIPQIVNGQQITISYVMWKTFFTFLSKHQRVG